MQVSYTCFEAMNYTAFISIKLKCHFKARIVMLLLSYFQTTCTQYVLLFIDLVILSQVKVAQTVVQPLGVVQNGRGQ